MARQRRADFHRQRLHRQHARREVDRNVERRAFAIEARGGGDRLFEDEHRQFLDPPALLGGGDEFLRADRALFGVGPARQRLGTADPAGAQVELGLERDPHLAIVDRMVELAEQRQPPAGILHSLGIVILPLEPFACGFVGGDQRAVEALADRAAAADLDPEGDVEIVGVAFDSRRAAEQRMQRLDMMADRGPRVGQPGEDAFVALEDDVVLRADGQALDDLVDERALIVAGDCGGKLRIIDDPRDDERVVALRPTGAKRDEIGQARGKVDRAARPEAPRDEGDGRRRPTGTRPG